ncbi:MAG: glycoside hydrolase family 65 protein [Armatimonadetes bacterium]|nr:glycoside hydrolase family 65 protein [Armatimonadota bacterium]
MKKMSTDTKIDLSFLVEREYQPSQDMGALESLFTLANGYMGTRGAPEEGGRGTLSGTYLAGVFDEVPGHVPELPVIPEWTRVRLFVDGAPFSLHSGTVLESRLTLDMKKGTFERRVTWQDSKGAVTMIRTVRMLSMDDRHLAALIYEVTPLNHEAPMRLESFLDASLSDNGPTHLEVGKADTSPGGELRLLTRTLYSKIEIAQAACHKMNSGGARFTTRILSPSPCGASCHATEWTPKRNVPFRLEKRVATTTSRDIPREDPWFDALNVLGKHNSESFENLVSAHSRIWSELWRRSDVEIQGDPESQRAIRFCIFHLLQCASPVDPRASIAAKGLSGPGYKGHVFWDTETFMLPFFIWTQPETARTLLTYRYLTLKGARKKAEENGYKGAWFAWESTDTGEETTPRWIRHPDSGKEIRIWCGDREQHISADVALAYWQYWQATGDLEFLASRGAEIIIETARFWASRAVPDSDGHFGIHQVIGPDEYHENIDNNVFTNSMAQWNIRKAIEVGRLIRSRRPDQWPGLFSRLSLTKEESACWENVAGHMKIGQDPATGLLIQFDGFLNLESVDLAQYEPRTRPMDVILGHEAIQRVQVLKQPDVLMLAALLGRSWHPPFLRTQWDFYEPRTAHGSSLSRGIHSLVASDLGETEKAYSYFVQSVNLDLADRMGNSSHGLHMAAMGGSWQALVFGFGGVKMTEEGLEVAPRLPRNWESLAFTLFLHNVPLRISITRSLVRVSRPKGSGGPQVQLTICGKAVSVEEGGSTSVPLR